MNKYTQPDHKVLVPHRLPTRIYVDGASRGNPGPSGTGLVVMQGSDTVERKAGLYDPQSTNNKAELLGILEALKVAKVYVLNGVPVEILSDSEYALKSVFIWAKGFKKRNWMTTSRTPVQHAEVIRECLETYEPLKDSIQVIHTKAHAGIEGNETADQLANIAIDRELTDWTIIKD